MLCHVNCSCLPQFFFFLNLSVTCWLTVGRLSVTCRSTDGQQLTDSWPTGFLGSSSSQLLSIEQLTGTSTSDSEEELDSLTPLFFLYDCERTCGSVYTDHIIELASVVQSLPHNIQIASPLQFQCLVYTAKRIAPVGKLVGITFILSRKAVINCWSHLNIMTSYM